MKNKPSVHIPDVSEILEETSENYNQIVNNIARMNSAIPNTLLEAETNTNMLLVIKRYINDLSNTSLILTADDLTQVHKLVSISDNITNATFVRVSELLNVRWYIWMVNPNHNMSLRINDDQIIDEYRVHTERCTTETMLLKTLQYIIDYYGELDLKKNIEYIPSYSVNNIVTAIKGDRKISSYLFEKFSKIWNISYSYTIVSKIDPSVQKTIVLDPSGWM